MEPLPMMVKVFLIRLGREYERCKAAGNARRLVETEHILGAVALRRVPCEGVKIVVRCMGAWTAL